MMSSSTPVQVNDGSRNVVEADVGADPLVK
jgi:hypothetical protein